MFRAAHRSSSGDLTVFAAFGLRMHEVTGRSEVRFPTQIRNFSVFKMHSLHWLE
jgi:hypothetical protein